MLTKSLKDRQVLLERMMEMVIVFETDNNFFWVQMIVQNVLEIEMIARLGKRFQSYFVMKILL